MKLMVIGFPKAGTTSITKALNASGLRSAHWWDDRKRLVGSLIYRDVLRGLDPFADLSGYDAITQADACIPQRNWNFWPNLDFAILNAIRRAHPSCLFLLNYRRSEAICESIIKWRDLKQRLCVSDIPGLPRGYGDKREHLIAWIENHYEACRRHFADDQYFLELDIEGPDVPDRLGAALGIPIVGWGDFKPNPEKADEFPLDAQGREA